MRNALLFLFLFPQLHFAQEYKTVFKGEQKLTADLFAGVDEYKNLYTVSGRVFNKISSEKTYQFSDLQLGKISSVDLINPLRITLFYDQFNTAVILDNTLNEITRINFNQLENFRNVSFARTASDRRLWIFNLDLQQLELFDYQANRVIASSPPLSEAATAMASNFNTCYVATSKALNIYNNYGSLLSTVNVIGVKELQQNNDVLLGIQNKNLLILPQGKMNFAEVNLVEKHIEQLYYANEILYIYKEGTLKTYILKLPKN